MKRLLGVMLLAVLFVSTLPAAAQDEEGASEEGGGEPAVIYKKQTTYDFEDDTISGDLTKPDGEYLEARKRARHKSLIRIREDFKERVVVSVSKL